MTLLQGCDVSSRVSGQTKRTNLIWICIWFGDTTFAIFPSWYRIFVLARTKRTNLIWFCIWFGDTESLYQSQPCLDVRARPANSFEYLKYAMRLDDDTTYLFAFASVSLHIFSINVSTDYILRYKGHSDKECYRNAGKEIQIDRQK